MCNWCLQAYPRHLLQRNPGPVPLLVWIPVTMLLNFNADKTFSCRCAAAPAAAPLPASPPPPTPGPVCASMVNPASVPGQAVSCQAQGDSRGAAIIPGSSVTGMSCTDLQQAQQMLQAALSPALGSQEVAVQVKQLLPAAWCNSALRGFAMSCRCCLVCHNLLDVLIIPAYVHILSVQMINVKS